MAGGLLNPVDTEVIIKGEKQRFVTLELKQMFNGHHQFIIVVNYLSPNSTFQQTPEKFIDYIGDTASISFAHKQTGDKNDFEGTITRVEMIEQDGQHGYVAIYGMSPTILLDNNPTMDSWDNKGLKEIVDDALKEYGGKVNLVNAPKFTEAIPYKCQYKESTFDFINRLSAQYGEWFYYDGVKVFFGDPGKNSAEKIVYDVDLKKVNLVATLLSPKYKRYDYVAKENKHHLLEANEKVENMDDFQIKAFGRAEKAYGAVPIHTAGPYVANETELNTQLKVAKTMAASQMINLEGIGKTCRIRIGNIIDVSFPDAMKLPPLGNFRITEVTHTVNKDGHYSNLFRGIPAGMKYIPVEIPAQIAMPEPAKVESNADDEQQGRVRVQFKWQESKQKKTNWIRVQAPDAGLSDNVSKNRGFAFIPEEDDQVMVGYEQGDPDRPYVSGSMYHSDSGKGGDSGNKIKSITTRSGNAVVFDDETGSILIVDQTGQNLAIFDGKDAITINAIKTIVLTNTKSSITLDEDKIGIEAKEICINGESLVVAQSGNQQFTITNDGDTPGLLGNGDNVVFNAKTMYVETADGDVVGKNININGTAQVDISGGLVKINS